MRKKSSFITLFALVSTSTFSQSVLLSPGKVETKFNGSNHIVLRGTSSPSVIGIRQSGTIDNPTNTTTADEMLNFEAQGWVNGNPTTSQGMLRFVSTQNWTNANRGNKLDIWTTRNGENIPYRRFTIDHSGKVGVGNYVVTSPLFQFEVQQPSDDDRGIGVFRYGGEAPSFIGVGANGITAIPLATQSSNILSRFAARGHNGTDYSITRARIDMVANENWTSTANGIDIRFSTTAGGTTTTEEKMVIRGNGNVGIGIPNPESKLAIEGDYQLAKFKVVDTGLNFNALNREGASVIVFQTDGTIELNGIDNPKHGMVLHLIVSSDTILNINNMSISGAPFCRIMTNRDNPLTINGPGGATLIYDSRLNVGQFWRVISFAE